MIDSYPKRRHLRPLAVVCASCVTLLGTACKSGPYQATLLVQGSEQLNPTFDGTPSAVGIRIIPLIDRAAFDAAKDEDLLATPQPNLAAQTWVPPHVETDVYIGQRRRVEIEIKPDVRFLGVIGLFNEQAGEHRRVLDVNEIGAKKLFFDGFSFDVQPRVAADDKQP